jgi:molecular chaperone DnaJ
LKCGGTGRISKIQQTILGNFQTAAICPDCSGSGKKYEKKCHECHGVGVTEGTEKIKVTIPGGIDNGQSIKLSGKGEASAKGHAGDLFIEIRVRPSKKFERDGDNIRSRVSITINQAVLGDKMEVETVDGPVSLKIPEGTESHTEFRLREKGVPHLRSRGRGDHLVEVIVKIPRGLSSKQEKLLKELGI